MVLTVILSTADGQIVNPPLLGSTAYDGWNNFSRLTYTNFPPFPGRSNWPRAIDSIAPGSGDAEITRLSASADGTGGAYPAEESLYFFSSQQVTNALGGTLRVTDLTPLTGAKTVVLQIQIGEAEGYDFHRPSGAPVLRVNGEMSGRASLTPVLIKRFQDGTFPSPETGRDEPVYVNTWGFQWDVSNIGAISSLRIEFSAVTHSQIYAMRLDQSSAAYTSSVFGGSTTTRIIGLSGNLGFGNVSVGQTTNRTLTISNSGNSTLTVTNITYPQDFRGSWSNGLIGLAANAATNITVTFAPTNAQSFSGNITVGSDATSGTGTIAASGTGTATATRVIGLGGNFAFGNVTVGQTTNRTLTISNSGNSTLSVTNISYPHGFRGSWSNGLIALGANAATNITVTFAPTNAANFSGNITVGSDATSGTSTASATGTGTAAATRIVSVPASLDFGASPVGSTRALNLTISNTGNSPLNVTGITYPSGLSGETSGSSIPSGGNRNITVTFAPDAVGGFSGSINVLSDSTAGSGAVTISGTGIAPAIRTHLSGTPQFNGSVTTVTHNFESTPATWLNIEFTDNLGDTNSWTLHSASVYSQGGAFAVTFTKSGDHRNSWQRGMFFRLSYPTKP